MKPFQHSPHYSSRLRIRAQGSSLFIGVLTRKLSPLDEALFYDRLAPSI
jgi:hypothetical protein